MKKLSKYKVQTSVLIILSLFITLVLFRLGVSSVLGDKEDAVSIERSLSLDSGNAEAAYRLGRLYQLLMTGDEKQAEYLYIDSLKHSPLLSSSWLGLTEIYLESEEEDKARITLRRALELIPSSIGLLWESSLLALSLGDIDLALDKLSIVAQADPRRRTRVFDICGQMVSDPDLILQRVVTDEILGDYLRYLISTDKQLEAYPVWERLEARRKTTPEITLPYVDYLLRKGDSKSAQAVWAVLYSRRGNNSLVWNGSFEEEIVGRGLDWRIRELEGADIDFDYAKKAKGKRSLKITFSGEKNADFYHVSQIVPVDPDSYYLMTSNIATLDITTRNGIRWQVYCKGMNEFSETYTGTVDWITTRISFVTPQGCNSVTLRLRRNQSNRLDNLISGEAWIDNVNLFKLGAAKDA